jgi:uncharacterized protein YbcI
MPSRHPEQESESDDLGAQISSAVVRLLADYTGRGPTRALTTIRGNLVFVLLHDTLTKGERALVQRGRAEKVRELRMEFQAAMSEDLVSAIEDLTGRKVQAFMSASHIDPDYSLETFVLEDGEAYDVPQITGLDDV